MRLAFIARMRAGKDTVAEYLIKKYGGKITKFADPIYEIQAFIYELLERELGITLPPNGKDRVLLQVVGTEWGRTIDAALWVKIFESRLRKLPLDQNVFVTDLRFENELACLLSLGFKVIYIDCLDEIRFKRGASHDTHISEKLAQDIGNQRTDHELHFWLSNNGTLEELYANIDQMLDKLHVWERMDVSLHG